MLQVRIVQLVAAALMAVVSAALMARAEAHETVPETIPVTVHAQAGEDRLDLLLRVPLVLLLEIDVPRRGPGYLDLPRVQPALERAAIATARALEVTENGRALQLDEVHTRISQPGERRFGSFEEAYAHIHGPPLPDTADVFWNQGYLDLHLVYPIESRESTFGLWMALVPGLSPSVEYNVNFVAADGAVRSFFFRGQVPELLLNPGWHQVSAQFVQLGLFHFLTGWEAIVLVLCLVLPLTRRLDAVPVVACFAAGLGVSLIALAHGAGTGVEDPWFGALLGTLAAAVLLYLAIENVLAGSFERRWVLGAIAGALAGGAFAQTFVRLSQFATIHELVGLATFALGLLGGLILALFALLGARHLLFRLPALSRYGILLVSIFVGHESWHALLERGTMLRALTMPVLNLGTAYVVFLLAVTLLFCGFVLWLLVSPSVRRGWHRLRSDEPPPSGDAEPATRQSGGPSS